MEPLFALLDKYNAVQNKLFLDAIQQGSIEANLTLLNTNYLNGLSSEAHYQRQALLFFFCVLHAFYTKKIPRSSLQTVWQALSHLLNRHFKETLPNALDLETRDSLFFEEGFWNTMDFEALFSTARYSPKLAHKVIPFLLKSKDNAIIQQCISSQCLLRFIQQPGIESSERALRIENILHSRSTYAIQLLLHSSMEKKPTLSWYVSPKGITQDAGEEDMSAIAEAINNILSSRSKEAIHSILNYQINGEPALLWFISRLSTQDEVEKKKTAFAIKNILYSQLTKAINRIASRLIDGESALCWYISQLGTANEKSNKKAIETAKNILISHCANAFKMTAHTIFDEKSVFILYISQLDVTSETGKTEAIEAIKTILSSQLKFVIDSLTNHSINGTPAMSWYISQQGIAKIQAIRSILSSRNKKAINALINYQINGVSAVIWFISRAGVADEYSAKETAKAIKGLLVSKSKKAIRLLLKHLINGKPALIWFISRPGVADEEKKKETAKLINRILTSRCKEAITLIANHSINGEPTLLWLISYQGVTSDHKRQEAAKLIRKMLLSINKIALKSLSTFKLKVNTQLLSPLLFFTTCLSMESNKQNISTVLRSALSTTIKKALVQDLWERIPKEELVKIPEIDDFWPENKERGSVVVQPLAKSSSKKRLDAPTEPINTKKQKIHRDEFFALMKTYLTQPGPSEDIAQKNPLTEAHKQVIEDVTRKERQKEIINWLESYNNVNDNEASTTNTIVIEEEITNWSESYNNVNDNEASTTNTIVIEEVATNWLESYNNVNDNEASTTNTIVIEEVATNWLESYNNVNDNEASTTNTIVIEEEITNWLESYNNVNDNEASTTNTIVIEEVATETPLRQSSQPETRYHFFSPQSNQHPTSTNPRCLLDMHYPYHMLDVERLLEIIPETLSFVKLVVSRLDMADVSSFQNKVAAEILALHNQVNEETPIVHLLLPIQLDEAWYAAIVSINIQRVFRITCYNSTNNASAIEQIKGVLRCFSDCFIDAPGKHDIKNPAPSSSGPFVVENLRYAFGFTRVKIKEQDNTIPYLEKLESAFREKHDSEFEEEQENSEIVFT
ncbi:MAG: hypothetical protein WC785_06625 [Tatlockia sp.]|jgi:hypothetical protein